MVQQWSSWSAGLPRITAVAVVPGTSDLVVGGTRLVRYSRLDTTDSGTTSADDHGPILAVGVRAAHCHAPRRLNPPI